MKITPFLFFMLLVISCASGKEKIYVGSTPANNVVRSFLGISLTDSVDFIRWKVSIKGNKYSLKCNYGIGKPNTKGFINGGKWIDLSGRLKQEKNVLYLLNKNKTLGVLELNRNLLHLMDENKKLLVGNGGWSYTLNINSPSPTDEVRITPIRNVLKDSIAYEGRTPCWRFANISPAANCIKQKWGVIFYTDPISNQPSTFQLKGTAPTSLRAATGTWKMISTNGKVIYQLHLNGNNEALRLLKIDENILLFTDEDSKLLVGNEDFSFTLNRRW